MVERFNRFLRTALKCQDYNEKWFDQLGLVLLGRNASFNSDLKMSRAEHLFGKKLCLPCFYFDESAPKLALDDSELIKSLINYFNKREVGPINTQQNYKPVHVDKMLSSCQAVYMCVEHVKKGLVNLYTGPFKVLGKFEKYFTIETRKGLQNISLDRLKPASTPQ